MNDSNLNSSDRRFIEIEEELWTLGEYLAVLERELPLIAQHQHVNRIDNMQQATSFDDDPAPNIAWYFDHEFKDIALPRMLRGPFIVSLWAVFESGVIEIGEYVREKEGKVLRQNDIRGEGMLERAKKYYEHILKFPFIDDQRNWQTLKMVNTIRDAIAHSNGRLDRVKPDAAKKIKEWVNANLGITAEGDLLILSKAFVENAYLTINGCIQGLIAQTWYRIE
jgi:hypothetical protein